MPENTAETRPAPPGDYWSQSRLPLTSLAFTAPLLAIYEAGLLCLGRDAARNGADAWLRAVLGMLGFGQYFLLPALVVGILLAWQHVLRQPWRVSRRALYGMAVECTVLAAALWFFWKIEKFFFREMATAAGLEVAATGVKSVLGTVVGYFGAGIYEELLFRMILLNIVIAVLAWLRAGRRASAVWGIVLTSLLFAAAHYLGPYGDDFRWITFLFRFAAGALFGVLFRYRGFGIAAGTHAFYDVLIGLSRAM